MNEFIIKDNILIAYRGDERDVVIPDGVTAIGERAFQYFTELQSVSIPNGVTAIGSNAFRRCIRLQSVILPDSICMIEEGAFWYCSELKNVRIPSGVTHIGKGAFCGCEKLREISLPSGVTEIGDSTFWHCRSLQSLSIPDSVSGIGDFAFLKCENLQKLTLSESVTSIMNSAFYGCARLCVTVTGTPVFHPNAFDGIACLIAPRIPPDQFGSPDAKRAAIRGYWEYREAFTAPEVNESYRKYLNAHRKRLLPEVFKNDIAPALHFYAEEKKIKASNFEKDYLNPAMEQKALGCTAFLLEFRDCHISADALEAVFERELTRDPYHAGDMRKLWSYKKGGDGTVSLTTYKGAETNVTVPPRIGESAVTKLSSFLFSPQTANRRERAEKIRESLQKIESVLISEGVKIIENCAFCDCEALRSVSVPESVTEIGEKAFLGCTALQSIRGKRGSYAEEFANQNRIPFEAEDDEDFAVSFQA